MEEGKQLRFLKKLISSFRKDCLNFLLFRIDFMLEIIINN